MDFRMFVNNGLIQFTALLLIILVLQIEEKNLKRILHKTKDEMSLKELKVIIN